ncbi:MAG: hypothetical protein LRS43_04335 [Desulfurococcales archaeon]|nr:hypothetical protein [Desulfurococcales archaeon]
MVDIVEISPLVMTGTIMLAAGVIGLYVYSKTRVTPLLPLSASFLFMSAQSFIESYIHDRIVSLGGSWDHLPEPVLGNLLVLETLRASLIVAWAGGMASVLVEIMGVKDLRARLAVPLGIWALGSFQSLAMNLLSDLEPVSQRIELSSIVRVYGFLLIVPLFAGFYIIDRMWRETGSRSLLYLGIAFVAHAVSISLYAFMKGEAHAALDLWYIVGGVPPSLLLLYAMVLLAREVRASIRS